MIYPKDTLMFRESAGEATDAEGKTYEMTTVVADGSPLIRSGQTGKWYHLTWGQLIALAVRAGIDREVDEGFRLCEFCGCRTNAKMRACCETGRAVDSATSPPPTG